MVRTFALSTLTVALFALTASADDTPKVPSEKEMMEAMMRAGTPGDHHKKLEALNGEWTFAIKMWMDPSKPPSESKGEASRKWILGGRYLSEKITGDFGGMPFEGNGVTGYDNLEKKYVAAWIDNMSTAIPRMTGTYDDATKTFTFEHESIDPVSGQKCKGKDVTRIVSEDRVESTFYKTMGGKEAKMMEIVYTKKK